MKTKCLPPPSHFIFFPGSLSLLHSQLFPRPEWRSGRGNGGSGQPRTALLLLPPRSFSSSSMGPSQGCSPSRNSMWPGVVSMGCRGMTRSTMVFPSLFRHSSPPASLTWVSQGCLSRFCLYSSLLCKVLPLLTADSLSKTRGCFYIGVKIPFLDTGSILSLCCRILSQRTGRYSFPAPALGAVGTAWAAPPDITELALLGGGITAGRYR